MANKMSIWCKLIDMKGSPNQRATVKITTKKNDFKNSRIMIQLLIKLNKLTVCHYFKSVEMDANWLHVQDYTGWKP